MPSRHVSEITIPGIDYLGTESTSWPRGPSDDAKANSLMTNEINLIKYDYITNFQYFLAAGLMRFTKERKLSQVYLYDKHPKLKKQPGNDINTIIWASFQIFIHTLYILRNIMKKS
ncbi:hypothetical protein Glove_130g175 [Diversispora epigaea]|uniref:Uncharacterized protein n=1 Tax=Diversispora epigaea TaxID=1348612 RepID=A0A397J6W4_9GLOM|nr:hypothetical protein Glove_130g175 [Diversispora epigaea]